MRRQPALAGLLLLIGRMNFDISARSPPASPLLATANGWGARGAGLLIGAFGIGAAAGLGLLLLHRLPRASWFQLAAVLSMGVALGGVAPPPSCRSSALPR